MLRWARRACLVALWCLAALLVPSVASYAATPAPAPTRGPYVAGGWSCEVPNAGDPGASPPVPASTATACVVTDWSPVVLPTPEPVAAPVVTVSGGGLTPDQESYLAFGLGLLVLLAAAHVVGGWRS